MDHEAVVALGVTLEAVVVRVHPSVRLRASACASNQGCYAMQFGSLSATPSRSTRGASLIIRYSACRVRGGTTHRAGTASCHVTLCAIRTTFSSKGGCIARGDRNLECRTAMEREKGPSFRRMPRHARHKDLSTTWCRVKKDDHYNPQYSIISDRFTTTLHTVPHRTASEVVDASELNVLRGIEVRNETKLIVEARGM